MCLQVLHRLHVHQCSYARAAAPVPYTPSPPVATSLPDPPVRRNYNCRVCGYHTSKAKLFLFHRRFVHGESITIYPCSQCEYASQNKSKTLRHRRLVHHKDAAVIDDDAEADPAAEEIKPVNELVEIDWNEIGADVKRAIMSDENQNQVSGGGGGGGDVDAETKRTGMEYNKEDIDGGEMVIDDEMFEEEEEYEDIDDEVSFKAVEKRKYLGENFRPKPSENAYEYIMCVSESVDGEPMYQCRMCSFESTHKWKIATHIRSSHMKQTVFKCPFCDFVCRRKIEWCVHKIQHTNKYVFSCDECLYRTTLRRNFDRHLAKHKNGGPIKCPRCTYSSTGEAAIQRHITDYHTSPEKEKENLVMRHEARDMTSPTTLSVQNNNNRHNSFSATLAEAGGDCEFQCNVCPMQFRTEAKLRQHMIAHSDEAPHTCPICSLSYKRPADLNRHMKRKHNTALQDYQKASPSPSHTNPASSQHQPEPLHYDQDSMDYTSDHNPTDTAAAATELPLDLTKRSGDFDMEEQDEPLDLSTPKKHDCDKPETELKPCEFGCHLCDSTYRYRSDLNQHLRLIHYVHLEDDGGEMEEEERNLITLSPDPLASRLHCQYCPYIGKYPAEVERHIKTHTGEKLWGCTFCSYKSIWKCDMKRHLQRHHATEVHMYGGDLNKILSETYEGDSKDTEEGANIPSKTPDDPSNTHTGQGDYACSLCPFVGESETHLCQHMEIHGNVKRFVCTHCGYRSNHLSEVRGHIKQEHLGASLDVMELPEEEARLTLDKYLQSRENENVAVMSEEKSIIASGYRREQPSKATERCRPFMCSQCGRRSNWRWDMNKHIRALHPSAHLITLSDKQAKETFDEYEKHLQQQTLLNNHAKALHQQQQQQMKHAPVLDGGISHVTESETDEVKQLVIERLRPFKCSTCGKRSNWRWDLGKHIKAMHSGVGKILVLKASEARSSIHEMEIQQLRQQLIKEPHTSTAHAAFEMKPSPPKRPVSQSHIDISKLKRFKCSLCAYRSNFRSDIGRHIKRKHHRSIASVVQLDPQEAAATLDEYHQVWARKKFVPTPTTPAGMKMPEMKRQKLDNGESYSSSAAADSHNAPISSTPRKVQIVSRQWQCQNCKFANEDKAVTEEHVSAMHPRSLMCRQCGDTFTAQHALTEHCKEEHDMSDDSDNQDIKVSIQMHILNKHYCHNKRFLRSLSNKR